MSMRERIAAAAALALLASCAAQRATPPAKGPALGQAVDAAEIARYDISIPPSGAGLPKGSGTARAGAAVYEQKCQACHGAKGAGKPVRTVGSYWPYATTLFDYVRRAMPITNPFSLSDEDTYAVTAYVLYLNGIIGEDLAMDAQSLPEVRMPNRDGFVSDWPPRQK